MSVIPAILLAGCGGGGGPSTGDPGPPPPPVERVFDFNLGDGGWLSGYSDYRPATAPTDVVTESRALPAPFTGLGLYAAGTNRSDDLFIYAKTKISGLVAGRAYRVSQRVEFLTDAPAGCVGSGGAPGESVWVVAGVSSAEPLTVFDGTDYRVNIDRGNQSQSGTEGVVLGNIANTVPDCGLRRWESKILSTPTPSPLSVRADARGEAWVLVGFDSGFESFSRLYYQRITVRLVPPS